MSLDPGTTHTGVVLYDTTACRVLFADAAVVNRDVTAMLWKQSPHTFDEVACEMIACYGMAVGAETFETCVWIGRFMQSTSVPFTRIYRQAVKMHLCNSVRAKDPNVRQALIDLHGGIACTKKGGALHGVASHAWAALGVAVTHAAQTRADLASARAVEAADRTV